MKSPMDRDRYSGNCLFKVEAGQWRGGTENDFVWRGRWGVGGGGGGGDPTQAPSMRYSERR